MPGTNTLGSLLGRFFPFLPQQQQHFLFFFPLQQHRQMQKPVMRATSIATPRRMYGKRLRISSSSSLVFSPGSNGECCDSFAGSSAYFGSDSAEEFPPSRILIKSCLAAMGSMMEAS